MALSIYSPNWDEYDSYGIIANSLANYLSSDMHINRIGLNSPDGSNIRPMWGGLMLGYPTLYAKYGVLALLGKRVALTMFESTQLPAGWVENLNKCAAVIVPTMWCADVFHQNGVMVPIHIVPLGINPVYLDVKRERRCNRPYTFVCLGDRQTRKGWDIAWHAFRSAFGSRDDVKLIIKTRAAGLEYINSADANVEFLRVDLTHEAMAEFFAECDCMVFPTLGEGFGLPPREFAATGGPVLVTRFAGTAEHLDEWGYGIPFQYDEAWPELHKYPETLQGCGKWAKPDVVVLARQMKVIVEQEKAVYDSAISKRVRVCELYDWAKFSDTVYKIYRSA